MEFLLLGPLEVHSARERLPLGGPRRRALLADLALHAGTVVSMDTLVEDLWSGEPPPTAEAVVQNGIAHLRRVLGRETIETRAPGYALLVDPGAIDAHRFERLVRDARPLPPAERSAALRDALALWRGPPFADLAFESFLQDEIARLDELRLTALEDRLEAEIELGRHDAVIADASALTVQHPSRERLCRNLMLALSRSGRQQDALDAYEELRLSLDESFGLEPSPETRALQLMILNQDPAIAAPPATPRAEGAVRRPVALLVVELLLDDDLELEEAGAALARARRALDEVVARHGGSVAPESGLELLACFGVDGAHEDDVLRASRAGVELREMLRGADVEARFAVGTGRLLVDDGRPVLVGVVVGQTRSASRDAAPGEMRVTAAAARLGGDALELDAEGRLLGVQPGRSRPSAAPSPFVGRPAELEALRSAFDQVVATGRPRHVVVVGEAGIGKTRLVAAAFENAPAVVLSAACVPYGEGITFLPLRELAERAAALDDSAPELGELTSADAALAAARAFLERFTARGPVVIVVDDVHWAVPTFLDLVEYVVRSVSGPLLVVCATRPELLERRPEWKAAAFALEPLSDEDARELVDGLREHGVLDDEVAHLIRVTAEGVPLFLEQLALYASEAEFSNEGLPPTLETLLASRIDGLEPGEHAVLARAAVVGRAFADDAIRALTPDAEVAELEGRLASLARRRLVVSRRDGHEFVHALVRDAAYTTVARSQRAELHERLARWLEGGAASDELVGMHLERAALSTDAEQRRGLARESATWLGRAGLQAVLAFDHAAACNLLQRAIALREEGDPDRLELECLLGLALKGLGRFDEAIEMLEAVAGRGRAEGNRAVELRARIEQIVPRLHDGSIAADEAEALLDEAVRLHGAAGDDFAVARAEMTHAFVDGAFRLRSDVAYGHIERAATAFRRIGVIDQVDLSAVVYAMRGSTAVADALALCQATIRRQVDRPRSLAYLRTNLAYLCALHGDLESAKEAAASARSELDQVGERVGLLTSAAVLLGSTEILIGDWEVASVTFESSLEHARRRVGERAWTAYFLARTAEVALARGDSERAAALAYEARALSTQDDRPTLVWWRRTAGRACALTGHPRKARRFAREAVAIADETDDLVERGEARLDLAEVLLRTGSPAEAESVAREGIDVLERKGAVLPAANGRARFAELLHIPDVPSPRAVRRRARRHTGVDG